MVGAAIVVIVALLAAGAFYLSNQNKSSSATQTASTSKTTSSQTGGTYKPGTYNATGHYTSPGGNQSITISLSVAADGTVTDTTATSGAIDRESDEWQGRFINGYKQQVVGKKISDIQLSRVSGSSLTSQGFNEAVDQISQQAKQS